MEIRNPYDRVRTPIEFYKESTTDTSFGNDTDVNNIIKRFHRTGVMPEPRGEGQYADVTGLQGDLTEQINKSREAIAELNEKQREYEQNQKNENANKIKELEEKLAALQKVDQEEA